MNLFQSLFGLKQKEPVDLANAFVLDVRSPQEFASGHRKGSVNIPLPTLKQNLNRIPKDKKIVTCCASGMRSGSAAAILRGEGYDAVNGGSWNSLG